MASPKLVKTALTVKGIEAAIKAAKATQKGREIGDALLPSFYCNVQASGHASFVLRYRHGKRSRKWTLGSYPRMTLEQARLLAREGIGDIARNIDIAAQKKVRRTKAAPDAPKTQTMARLVQAFFAEHVARNCRPSTGRSYTRWLEPVLASWGDRDPADIRRADVIELVEGITRRGCPVLANRTSAVIQKVFNWAIGTGKLEANPATKIEKAKEKSRQRVLSDSELKLLLEASDRLPDRERAYILILLHTLARRGEVGGMKWTELDLVQGTWTIPATRTKNGHTHVLPLSREAVAILQARPQDGPYVFASKTGSFFASFSQIKDQIDRLIEEATGAPFDEAWTLHDLRRSGASAGPRLEIRLEVIERLLNHVSGSFGGIVSTYQKYNYIDEMRKAAEAWSAHLARLAAATSSSFAAAHKFE